MTAGLSLAEVDLLTGGRTGTFDSPCPLCGPDRRSPTNRVRRVLRVWRQTPDFATFKCARCDLEGSAREASIPIEPRRLATVRAEYAERDKASAAERLHLARRLAARCQPPASTIAETYLRLVRCYHGRLPATLAFLPATARHTPAMLSIFGVPDEPEPGRLHLPLERVTGVHLTRLLPDGSGKAPGQRSKIMIGRSAGSPIVLAPMNDTLGLIVCEGIETGLSLAEATSCGVWAAGAAGRMPPLADAVPRYTDVVTIAAEDDDAGRRGADELARRLRDRMIHVEVRILRADMP